MSKHIRRAVARKLKEQIEEATDPKVIANLANVLAKYLPKPKQPRRPRGAQAPKEAEPEISLDQLVAAEEKKRKEARNSLNGGTPEGWLNGNSHT
jgi:hypothetical protein